MEKKDFGEIWTERGIRLLVFGVIATLGASAAYVAGIGGAPCAWWHGAMLAASIFAMVESIAGTLAGEMPRTATWLAYRAIRLAYRAIRLAYRTIRYIAVAECAIMLPPMIGAIRLAYRGIRACIRLAYRGIRACIRLAYRGIRAWAEASEVKRAAISLPVAAAIWAAMVLPLIEW